MPQKDNQMERAPLNCVATPDWIYVLFLSNILLHSHYWNYQVTVNYIPKSMSPQRKKTWTLSLTTNSIFTLPTDKDARAKQHLRNPENSAKREKNPQILGCNVSGCCFLFNHCFLPRGENLSLHILFLFQNQIGGHTDIPNWDPPALLLGMYNGAGSAESSLAVSQKVAHEITMWSINSTCRYIPILQTETQTDICTPMLIAALFKRDKR